jgi:hypothetical protein
MIIASSWWLSLERFAAMAVAFPFNESHRLRRLKMFGILDTPAEEHFDSITKVAASLLQAPIALLNFIAVAAHRIGWEQTKALTEQAK